MPKEFTNKHPDHVTSQFSCGVLQTVGRVVALKQPSVQPRATTVCLAGQDFNRAVSHSSGPLLVDCVFKVDFIGCFSVCTADQQQFGLVAFPQ